MLRAKHVEGTQQSDKSLLLLCDCWIQRCIIGKDMFEFPLNSSSIVGLHVSTVLPTQYFNMLYNHFIHAYKPVSH